MTNQKPTGSIYDHGKGGYFVYDKNTPEGIKIGKLWKYNNYEEYIKVQKWVTESIL